MGARSGGLAAGAKAGHRHGQIGAGGGEVHALADERGLRSLAAPLEAVQQPAQGPQVVRVNLRAGQCAAEAEILAIDHLGFRSPALLQQQSAERVADRLHPAPWLVVGQVVLQRDGGAETVEGRVVLAAAISDLALKHLLGHRQQLHAGHVVEVPGLGYPFRCLSEQ